MDLIEDHDGAPLPAELQPDTQLYADVRQALRDFYDDAVLNEATADVLIALAPHVWPYLPSNDHSAASRLGPAHPTEQRREALQAWFDQIQVSEQSCSCTPRLSGGRRTLFTHQVGCPVYAALWGSPSIQAGPQAP